MLPVRLAVLNCETLIAAVFVAIQDPTATVYNTVLVPIAANEGVIIPGPLIEELVVKVPPPGVAIIATVLDVLQSGVTGVIVGDKGFTTVTVNVCNVGQLYTVGVTTTLYTTSESEPVIG
jgi:hypothetical protein